MIDIAEELVQIVKFGVNGDAERVRIQVMRLIRSLRATGDPLADLLQQVMVKGDFANQATRSQRKSSASGISAAVPVDTDSRLDLLRVEDPPHLPHQLICNDVVTAQLARLIDERKAISKLSKIGLHPTRTVLFTGPPGVGKTMAARHIAAALKRPLLTLDLATSVSSFLGRTGNNLKQAFEFARSQPCVLFLDELDAVAKRRDDDGDIGELKRLVTVILQELDLWPSDNLLISATNHGQLLDAAVWRRFETIIDFPRPERDELVRLSSATSMKGDPLPKAWSALLTILLSGTSQSEFVKQVDRLRRAIVIGGSESGEQVLSELVFERSDKLSKAEKKELAVSLVKDANLTQRSVNRLTGIARETLRTALGGGKNG